MNSNISKQPLVEKSSPAQFLSNQNCAACHRNSLAVTSAEMQLFIKQLPDWELVSQDSTVMLQRVYIFKNYSLAWSFSNKVSALAEELANHPAIILEWGKVTVSWWTHSINALHKNDFISAAKTDQIFNH